ncbi:MAG: hypothetical protein NTV70_15295 [Acidobacteria bacterium]|nr:hypothetical protein [Acidobacteriota bacterium]
MSQANRTASPSPCPTSPTPSAPGTAPFEPGKPDRITFSLPDVAHTFRAGHRIMVQIQSSWFPLTDRNPQKFMEIPKALSTDFVKATQRVYFGGTDGSKITLPVEER